MAYDLLGGDDPPIALFAAQNLVTIGAVQPLRRLGVRARVALVGFDDIPLADPGITVLPQNAGELGRLTADVLFARSDGDDGPSRRLEVPTILIERGSGELWP